jgi:hypothetical protein
MTTFEEAKHIIDDLKARGIEAIELSYKGWSSGGLFGDQPKHTVERSLGGRKQLEQLIEHAEKQGIRVYLETNYVKPYDTSSAFKPRYHAIRGIDRKTIYAYKPHIATRQPTQYLFYFAKPQWVYDRYVTREADDLAALGASGIISRHMGDTLYSDQTAGKEISREGTKEVWLNSLDTLREAVGKTAVDYGFAYTFGHVDRIDDVPLDSSHYVMEDETIPFYQIALRGLVPYTGKPINTADDARVQLLRAVEYGAMLSFYFTNNDPVLLKNSVFDDLISSKYDVQVERSVDRYQRSLDLLNRVVDEPIADHEKLADKVYRTTFDNGVSVIVNYNAVPVEIEGSTIGALDFAVFEGGSRR